MQEILDGIPLPAIVVSPEERVVAANELAEETLLTAGLGGKVALSLRAPEFLAALAEVLAGGAPAEARFRLTRDGTGSLWAVQVSRVPTGAFCVFRDLSEEEQASQMRRDFVANVSHELRTPLTALIGFIETLRGAARDDPAARDRFLSIMDREAGRMNRLVRDLLHLSRVEAEERVRPTTEVDLWALLASVVHGLKPVMEQTGSTVVISGEPGPLLMPGDADQLTQVFQNLIENALKYGVAGQEVRVRVAREPSVRGEALRVDVADRGEGIDPVHLPRLTERFYRVDSHRSREKGGTGLGLAIVKHIVVRHRGWLKIDSVKGEGSCFSVILPVA
jgi:two-component system phosphate regulon sensor histidine kinase PhoR